MAENIKDSQNQQSEVEVHDFNYIFADLWKSAMPFVREEVKDVWRGLTTKAAHEFGTHFGCDTLARYSDEVTEKAYETC